MHQNSEFEFVYSVPETANSLGLSRQRFYQLLKEDVFPPPVYCPYTRRPFYPVELQNECLRIRETGIGRNGQPIWFYSPRKKKSKRRSGKIQVESSEHLRRFSASLRELGVTATTIEVKNALDTLFPEGSPADQDEGAIIVALFRHFKPERTNDV